MQIVAGSACRTVALITCWVLVSGCASHAASDFPPPERLTVGRWQSVASKKYVATLTAAETPRSGWYVNSPSSERCGLLVEISAPEPDGVTACVKSGQEADRPAAICVGHSMLILAVTSSVTRVVSLQLSNGTRIASSVFMVHRRDVPLIGIYYQILPTRQPRAIRLKEIDEHGATVKIRALHPSGACRRARTPPRVPVAYGDSASG